MRQCQAHPEVGADYVLTDHDGLRSDACADCAANAVQGKRPVTVTPIEAVYAEEDV